MQVVVCLSDGYRAGFSQGQATDTDLPNARMKVALQFVLQGITFSHLNISVNIFQFYRNFSVLTQNILGFAKLIIASLCLFLPQAKSIPSLVQRVLKNITLFFTEVGQNTPEHSYSPAWRC